MNQPSDLQVIIEIVLFILVCFLMVQVIKHEWGQFKELFRKRSGSDYFWISVGMMLFLVVYGTVVWISL